LLALIPSVYRAMQRHARLLVAFSVIYVALLLFHPYLFGLPGRIAEVQFQRHIRLGMKRSEIVRSAKQYGGTGPGFSDVTTAENSPYDWRSDASLDVYFIDFATLCVTGGRAYYFYFRPDFTLMAWKSEGWSNAC